MLAALPSEPQNNYACGFYIADKSISFGRVESNSTERQNFWRKWCDYIKPWEYDPYLRNEDFGTVIRATNGFARRVRQGHLGRGNQVTCPKVQTAARAIGQTYELDLGFNPLYRAHERYLKPIEIMFSGFRQEDPLPVSEIAIPVGVAQQIACIGLMDGATPKETTVGDLTLITFYYLLRVGEYTRKYRCCSAP